MRILKWGFEYLIYMRKVRALILERRPASVLDVGCGDGYLLGQLPDDIPIRCGVDINERALAFARAFFPEIDYRSEALADVEEQFDVVSAVEVLEHIPDAEVEGFLKAAAERVKPGGALIVTIPSVNIPLNPKHFRHYDRALLSAQLAQAIPEMKLERMMFYYVQTRLESLYQRLSQNRLVYGEIPVLRRAVWKHASDQADKATDATGRHLIAILTRPA